VAAIIRLEDGRGLAASSLSLDAMLTMIAEQVGDGFARLRTASPVARPGPRRFAAGVIFRPT